MNPQTADYDDKSLLSGVLSAIPEPFFVYDDNGTYLDVLGGSDRSKYHDARHLIGKRMHEIMDSDLADRLLGKIRETIESGTVTICEYQIDPMNVQGYKGRPGPVEKRWVEAHISPIDGKRQVVFLAFDITDKKKVIERLDKQSNKLRELARIDPLTGLMNRRSFFEKALEVVEQASRHNNQQIWVLMMDLDFFKKINDRYGHHAGDRGLKHFAYHMQQCSGGKCAIGRLGGEEFAAIHPAASKKEALAKAENVRKTIEESELIFNEHRIHFTVSIGISRMTEEEQYVTEALKRADAAMYQAKRNGRNCVWVYREGDENL